jgi:hypothetical protein
VVHSVRIAPEPTRGTVTGIASHMGHTEPLGYLALPTGRHRRATICGPIGCVTRVSTDAGPSKAMRSILDPRRYPHAHIAQTSPSRAGYSARGWARRSGERRYTSGGDSPTAIRRRRLKSAHDSTFKKMRLKALEHRTKPYPHCQL